MLFLILNFYEVLDTIKTFRYKFGSFKTFILVHSSTETKCFIQVKIFTGFVTSNDQRIIRVYIQWVYIVESPYHHNYRLQIKRSNLMAFLYAQIFVPVRIRSLKYKSGDFYLVKFGFFSDAVETYSINVQMI